MPSTSQRLRVREGILGALPYLCERQQSDERRRLQKGKGRETLYNDAYRIPPLAYYALKSLLVGLDEEPEGSLDLLSGLEDLQRIPFDHSIAPLLYPTHSTINTSPLHWLFLCRLFSSLPDDLKIFHLPLSDPYLLTLQKWGPPQIIGVRLITTVSLGRLGGDSTIPAISKLCSLVALDLSGSTTSTIGIKRLSIACGIEGLGTRKLAVLMLAGCPIGNDVVESLKVFTQLQYIDLRRTKVAAEPLINLFPDKLPDEMLNLQLLSARNIFNTLRKYSSRAQKKTDSEPDTYICEVDRLDYPVVRTSRKTGSSNPHQIFSQGYFFAISPNGKMKMGDAETLVKTQERPSDHDKPLPMHLYDAANGVTFSSTSFNRMKNGSQHKAEHGFTNSRPYDGTIMNNNRQPNGFYKPLRDNSPVADMVELSFFSTKQQQQGGAQKELDKIFFRSKLVLMEQSNEIPGRKEKCEQVKRVRTMFPADKQSIASSIAKKYTRAPEPSTSTISTQFLVPRNPFRIGRS